MQFEFSLEDYHFFIELIENPSHKADLKHSHWVETEEDLELWHKGKLTYFQILITSENSKKEQLNHYAPSILLPKNNEQDLQERIELFMDSPEGLDKILAHWEHFDAARDSLPDWSK